MLSIRALLTPEQRQKLLKFRSERMKMRKEQEQSKQINKAIYTEKLGNWKLSLAQGKQRHPDMDLDKIQKQSRHRTHQGQQPRPKGNLARTYQNLDYGTLS